MAYFKIHDALPEMTKDNKVYMAYGYAENKEHMQEKFGLNAHTTSRELRRPDGTLVDTLREERGQCPDVPRDTYCVLEDGVSVTDSPGCLAAQAACDARLDAFCGNPTADAFQGCVITRPFPDEHPHLYRWEPEADSCQCSSDCC